MTDLFFRIFNVTVGKFVPDSQNNYLIDKEGRLFCANGRAEMDGDVYMVLRGAFNVGHSDGQAVCEYDLINDGEACIIYHYGCLCILYLEHYDVTSIHDRAFNVCGSLLNEPEKITVEIDERILKEFPVIAEADGKRPRPKLNPVPREVNSEGELLGDRLKVIENSIESNTNLIAHLAELTQKNIDLLERISGTKGGDA